nr:hypothetical protein [Tanacetum cinerariifolium]
MDQDSAHMVAASKVSMLKPGEFEIWRMRIEQYIQMMDYALWEVIENGVTFLKTQVVEGVTIDAKQLLKAIEKRFGRNAAPKKTQRNLLKQQYENFTASSSEMLEQNFDRLQKLVSQLELLEEKLSQEYVNQKTWNKSIQMVLRWKMALSTMRAGRFLKRTGRKLTVNGNKTIGFDKFTVECYNCHKKGHFARECRAQINQDNKYKESPKRSMPMEITNSTALVPYDGLGRYDWSDQEEEGPNYALMDYSSSSSDSKTGLEPVEERLKYFKTNESVYLEDIKVLKVEIQMGEISIRELRKKLEIAQKEKDGIQLNVEKFENASKSLNKLMECQIVDNYKKGLGYENYNAVPPPYTGNFMPSTPDLSFFGLDEFANKPVAKKCEAKSSEEETSVVRKNDDALIIKE